MSYVAENPSSFAGKAVGTGQCVAYVQAAAKCPYTALWTAGAKVAGNKDIPTGTAIASFDPDGTYGNHVDGRSHAAIYVSQDANGILVWDQWLHQVVHQRTLRYYPIGGAVKNVNNAWCFSVIEEKKPEPKPTT
jgi:hypothetical protein